MQQSQLDTNRSRDQMKGVLRQVFSTTTLSKSLKKLNELNRSASQSKISRIENSRIMSSRALSRSHLNASLN